ncbi:MAG: MBL fold metallo-hydrolase [Erysipelotrichia bacterium]|nr:MBL fold metallo-hydrolase [Erysipelotrichia bacterium]
MILISAFSVILIGLFNNFSNRIIVAICIIGFLPLFCDKKSRFIISFIILTFVLVSYPIEKTFFESGRVIEIRDKYYLISDGLSKIVLYTDEALSLDDKVNINQKVKSINYYDNFNLSTYIDYCRANNIIGTISKNDLKVIRSKFSIRKIIYNRCLKSSNKWILQLLFKNSMEIESDKKFFITQSSLHISFFASLVKSVLSLLFYEKTANRIVFVIILLLGLFFNFPYGYVRILISLALFYFIADKRKRLSYEILILAFYKPYYIKTISFLIPMGIKVINCFLKEKRLFLIYFYIIIIQLSFYGQIDIIAIISFAFLKSIFGMVYLLALVFCLFPFEIKLDKYLINSLEIIDNFPKVEFSGTFNLVLLFIILFLIIKYFETIKNKYLLGLMLVFLVNNNRLLFSPIYTVTFLDVGQGDCSLITFPYSSKGLLIDVAGNVYKDIGKDIIIPYLNSLSIKSIDVIISHDDYDHCGGLQSLVNNFKVNNIYRKKQEKFTFESLNVYTLLHDENYQDVNDNSIISYFKINQFYFLYLGDVSKEIEYKLVEKYDNLQIDVLKLSHHGSNSATSEKMLATYDIPLAIISAGRNNFYNHPPIEVIERLNQFNIPFLSTKKNHAIRFYVLNHLLIYQTSSGQWGFLLK